jgi:chromosome segregation ATPase
MTDATQTPDGFQNGQAAGQDYEKLFKDLSAQIESGTLISTEIKKRIDSGELFLKERFAGVQRSLNEAIEEKKTLSQSLATNQVTVEALAKHKTEMEAAQADLQSKLANVGVSLSAAEKKAARKDMILNDFPQLAPFEKEGLLPDVDLEKLPGVLGAFWEKVNVLGVNKAQISAAGGSIGLPEGKAGAQLAAKDLLTLVQNASLGDTKNGTYEELYTRYLDAAAKEEKPTA